MVAGPTMTDTPKPTPARLLGALVIAIVVTLVSAFLLDATISSDRGDQPAATNATSGGASTGKVELRIKDFAFQPATLKVTVGDTITVINEDDAKHTVTSGTRDNPDGTFDVQIDGGATETFTIDAAGTYPYICTIHPGMKGMIEVSA